MSVDDEVLEQPVQGTASLIIDPNYDIEFTAYRETDSRGGALRGLKEYISDKSVQWFDGKEVRPLKVFESAADFEDQATYPSIVLSTSEVSYDSAELTGGRYTQIPGTSPPIYYRVPAEVSLQISIDLYCTSKLERTALIALLEDVLEPVDWQAGFRLVLPFYHNAVCSYLKSSLQVFDPSDNTNRRLRLGSIIITAELPQVRLVGTVPGLDPRVEVIITEDALPSQ